MKAAAAPGRPLSIQWAVIYVAVSLAAVLAVSAFVIGVDALADNLGKFTPNLFLICLLLMTWQVGCRFARWYFFARNLGVPMGPGEAVLYYGAGFGVAVTPGRLGELLRLWFLERRFAIPYRRLAGLYVADRLSDATAYLVLLAVGAMTARHLYPVAWVTMLAPILLALAVVTPRPGLLAIDVLYGLVRGRFAGRGRKMFAWLRRAIRNMSILFRPRVYLAGLLIGTIGWCAAPLVLSLSLAQLGISLSPFLAAAIYAAGALAGGASMLPGGVGASDTVLVVLLVAADVPIDAAIASMIVTRITFLWTPVGLGLVVLPVALRHVRRRAAAAG